MKNNKNNTSDTLLGEDSEFNGDIKFFGTLTIEGAFKGNISGEGTVIINANGDIKANIHTSEVIVNGTIHGQVSAEKNIYINKSGMIFGDIEAPNIQIVRGALFKGKCTIHKVIKPSKDEQAIINPM